MTVSSAIIIRPREDSSEEFPAHQDRQNDPEFEDQIGRGELEGQGRDEIGPEDRSRQGHSGGGAG
jgi:hypothetical protein